MLLALIAKLIYNQFDIIVKKLKIKHIKYLKFDCIKEKCNDVLVEKESNQDFKCSFILGFDHPLRKQNFWIGSLTLFLFYQVIIWLIFSKQIPKPLVLFEHPIYRSLFFFLYLLSFIFYLLCISILLIYCENRVSYIKIFLEFISLAFSRHFLLF